MFLSDSPRSFFIDNASTSSHGNSKRTENSSSPQKSLTKSTSSTNSNSVPAVIPSSQIRPPGPGIGDIIVIYMFKLKFCLNFKN
jgi:hypothetical protein